MRGVQVDPSTVEEQSAVRPLGFAGDVVAGAQGRCRNWLTPPPFDHSELMVVDGCWVLLGSANWGNRSLRLNFEYNPGVLRPGTGPAGHGAGRAQAQGRPPGDAPGGRCPPAARAPARRHRAAADAVSVKPFTCGRRLLQSQPGKTDALSRAFIPSGASRPYPQPGETPLHAAEPRTSATRPTMSASGLWIAGPPAPNLPPPRFVDPRVPCPSNGRCSPRPRQCQSAPCWRGPPGATGPGGAVLGVHDGLHRCAYPENPIGEVTGEPSARPRLSLEAQQNVEAIKVWPPPLPAVQVIPHPLQHTARKETHPFLVNVSPSPRGSL